MDCHKINEKIGIFHASIVKYYLKYLTVPGQHNCEIAQSKICLKFTIIFMKRTALKATIIYHR